MSKDRIVELTPIKESSKDFEVLEKRLKDLFKKLIYLPILKEIEEKSSALKNAPREYEDLMDALFTGRVTFNRGTFSGRFSAGVSKDLKRLGARWDRKNKTFKIPQSSLPLEVGNMVRASADRFQRRLEKIDAKLAKVLPEEISSQLKATEIFDQTLWRTNEQFAANVKSITIAPQLTPERRKRIAEEWSENMDLWIKKFTEKQIKTLRQDVQKAAFSGDRYGTLVDSIQKSYRVSANKAKFLARQETGLLMAKFKETRYEDSGVREYKWKCVAGSKAHPVRPRHRELSQMSDRGKIFRFDDPPVTTESGQPERRNNPGQDYNCRCMAIPVVRFRKT